MSARLVELGLSGCSAPFKVAVSDFNGEDIVAEIKDEINKIMDDPACHERPIPFYAMTGVLGAVRAETFSVLVHGGVPLILDPSLAIDGGSSMDMHATVGNTFVERMYCSDSCLTYSLGYVDSMDEVYPYAVKYTRENPLVKDSLISDSVVSTYISSNPDTVVPLGRIQRIGGSLFDVYGFNMSESGIIRTDKDYIGGDPYKQDGIPANKIEVILYGGDPEIVPVGAICGLDGDMFTVWVPNGREFIDCASNMLKFGDIDLSGIYLDQEELIQAYTMYADKLLAEERKADSEAESGDVPDTDFEYIDDEFSDES